MNKQYYRTLLDKLPILNPSVGDIATMFPHLTPEQVTTALAASNEGMVNIACPSIYVEDTFHVISCFREGETGFVSMLSYSGSIRIKGSSQKELGRHAHIEEAVKFSQENWGAELTTDAWMDVIETILQDPSDLDRGYPKTKARLTICFDQGWNSTLNDHSKPKSKVFDAAIVQMTLDPVIGCELQAGRPRYSPRYNCSICGAGLQISKCSGCGRIFKDDAMRSGWSVPLSEKMVRFVTEHGFSFKQDPATAWAMEEAQFLSES